MKAIRTAPLQITFRNLAPSVAVKIKIQELLAKLEGYGGRVDSCRVTVEALKAGPPAPMRYHIGVVAHVLGRALVADSELHGHFGGAYVYVPIHSAFDTIRRQL
jgi:ribosome-associated translation inhibitor RaiA